jgi:hypothetical protein
MPMPMDIAKLKQWDAYWLRDCPMLYEIEIQSVPLYEEHPRIAMVGHGALEALRSQAARCRLQQSELHTQTPALLTLTTRRSWNAMGQEHQPAIRRRCMVPDLSSRQREM